MPSESNESLQLNNAVSLSDHVSERPSQTLTRIPIASSESFETEDLARFLAAESATIASLIGDRDSGKSTLLCSIYDRLLHGPFAGRRSFAVRTITGLERRAHHERLKSGRSTPDTERTSLAEGLRYFHFGTSAEEDTAERSHLLISDRAGEKYKDARANPALVSALTEFPLADFLVIMVDGARVAELTARAGAFFAVQQTLQMLADSGAADANTPVQVVLTKQDLIEAADGAATLRTKITEFTDRLLTAFGHRFRELTFLEIAARAYKGQFAPASGVDALLKTWLSGGKKKRTGVQITAATTQTEFDKLADRSAIVEENQ